MDSVKMNRNQILLFFKQILLFVLFEIDFYSFLVYIIGERNKIEGESVRLFVLLAKRMDGIIDSERVLLSKE